ncbi:5529_t:CDS:2 [Gigaspora margarita]|uniref:5529_t:CDS:1 n=1 Tax=Gigaspora margarita TaxID=4874 RepID=A0ABM8W2S9_GIGMA|nr:5529_t:CDS:2 [Gigaspora margarita]
MNDFRKLLFELQTKYLKEQEQLKLANKKSIENIVNTCHHYDINKKYTISFDDSLDDKFNNLRKEFNILINTFKSKSKDKETESQKVIFIPSQIKKKKVKIVTDETEDFVQVNYGISRKKQPKAFDIILNATEANENFVKSVKTWTDFESYNKNDTIQDIKYIDDAKVLIFALLLFDAELIELPKKFNDEDDYKRFKAKVNKVVAEYVGKIADLNIEKGTISYLLSIQNVKSLIRKRLCLEVDLWLWYKAFGLIILTENPNFNITFWEQNLNASNYVKMVELIATNKTLQSNLQENNNKFYSKIWHGLNDYVLKLNLNNGDQIGKRLAIEPKLVQLIITNDSSLPKEIKSELVEVSISDYVVAEVEESVDDSNSINLDIETERINNLVSNQTKEILQLKEEWYFNDSYKNYTESFILKTQENLDNLKNGSENITTADKKMNDLAQTEVKKYFEMFYKEFKGINELVFDKKLYDNLKSLFLKFNENQNFIVIAIYLPNFIEELMAKSKALFDEYINSWNKNKEKLELSEQYNTIVDCKKKNIKPRIIDKLGNIQNNWESNVKGYQNNENYISKIKEGTLRLSAIHSDLGIDMFIVASKLDQLNEELGEILKNLSNLKSFTKKFDKELEIIRVLQN